MTSPLQPPLALIFDMDGVLVDSEPLHKRAKEMAFNEFGIVLPESVYDSYKGRPDATVLGEILQERSLSHRLQDALRLKHQFFESIEHGVRAVPGAVEFVLWAKSRYRIALATSATPRNRAKALNLLGIGDYFEVVIDADGFEHPKPDPEIFLTTMKRLHLSAIGCWVTEDSVNGLRAAKAAGCVAVAITTTFDANALSAAGADLVVNSFAELRVLLESL
jgi:beta-phosphoglucomutase